MDEQGCPRCKTTRYRNPALRLLVNVCGHSLCDNCVELLFVRGSGACPQCNVPLRRNNFRAQLFEDATVEREVDIRKKVLKDFNRREEDFATLDEYNDYLELVETLVFNMTHGIDLDATNKRIEKYRKDNQEEIRRNRTKLGRDEEYLDELIEIEREVAERVRQEALQEQQKEAEERQRNRTLLLDRLASSSDGSAAQVVASHRRELAAQREQQVAAAAATTVPRQRHTQFSSGVRLRAGRAAPILEAPRPEDVGEIYTYTPLHVEFCGPDPPSAEQLFTLGYLCHVRPASAAEEGGGFSSVTPCCRALQEAFSGLYFISDRERDQPTGDVHAGDGDRDQVR